MKPKKEKLKKRGRGQPTKYKERYCDEIVQFFTVEPYHLVTTEHMTEYWKDGRIKKELERQKPMPSPLPTLFRFAEKVGVDVNTLHNWVDKFPDFFRAFTRAKELQKEFLMTLGMAGITPPATFMFIASNLTDLRNRGVAPEDLPPGSYLVPVIIRRGEIEQQLPVGRKVIIPMNESSTKEQTTIKTH
jgi:hypothetical protein